MTSNPKRWVIKPFTPKLEQSDLRSILSPTGQPQSPENMWSSNQEGNSFRFSLESITVTGMQPTVMGSSGSGKSTPDMVVQARQVSVSEDGSDSEDWRPSTPSNPSSPETASSTGSHVGFYSFVDDPASPEAEMNEVYMISPKRQAKLNTLKEKSTFKLQTYTEEKRPGRLFKETNGDDLYSVKDASTVNEEEENPDRIEIIRNQAPKKSPALKEQWSALENLNLSNTPQRLLDGFSLRYKTASAKTEQARVEPGTIDNEQIDFNAARKQFLMMEQSKQNPFLQSLQQLPYSPKLRWQSLSSTANIFTPKQVSKDNSVEEDQIPLATQQEAKVKTVTVTEDPEDEVPSGAIGDVDSGLSDLSGGYTSNGSILNEPSISEMGSSLTMLSAEETPIQREIRISQQREESLRRSRGILRTDNSEMVEIRTKPILTLLSPKVKAAKAKETNRVSFLIQRELELEKQRQNPQSVSSHHIRENQVQDKKSFESQANEILITSLRTSLRESPSNDVEQRAVSANDMWITEQPVLVDEGDISDSKEALSPCCPHRHPDESMLQRNTDSSTFGNQAQMSAYSEENNHSKVKVYKENGVDSQTNNIRTKKESSWIAENDNSMLGKNRLYSPNIPSPLDPEKNSWYTPTRRSHLEQTNWSPKMQNAPDSIRQEIEKDLRREQELQELRESFSVPTSAPMTPVPTSSEPRSPLNDSEESVFSPQTPHGGMAEVDSVLPEKKTDYSYPYSWSLDTSSVSRLSMADKSLQLSTPRPSSRLPSMSIMTPQPWGSPKPMSPTVSRVIREPLSTLADVPSPLSQKGLTETLLKDFEDRRVKLKLEESAYAGIQPVDAINNEVVEATRVTRHKNQRALQWEAGMYTNQES